MEETAPVPEPGIPIVPHFVILPAAHWLLQISNTLLLISYGFKSILYLRIVLALASLGFILWSVFVLRLALDTILWNTAFFVINTGHVAKLLYDMRDIKFDPDKHFVWENVFYRHLHMDKHTFKELTDCCHIRVLRQGEYYAKLGDAVDDLAVLIHGKLEVYEHEEGEEGSSATVFLHQLISGEFVNSSEISWEKDHYDVSIQCFESCRLLVWPKDYILHLRETNPELAGLMNGVTARDISKKLQLVENTLAEEHHRIHLLRSGKKDEQPLKRANASPKRTPKVFHHAAINPSSAGGVKGLKRSSRPVTITKSTQVAIAIDSDADTAGSSYEETTYLLGGDKEKDKDKNA